MARRAARSKRIGRRPARGIDMTSMIWIGGAVAGAVVVFLAGYLVRARIGAARRESAERQAQSLLEQAAREAESAKRGALLEGREEALRLKQQIERENQVARSE